MPVFKPDRFVIEESPAPNSDLSNQALWLSEAGGLSAFGAFVGVLQPGSRPGPIACG